MSQLWQTQEGETLNRFLFCYYIPLCVVRPDRGVGILCCNIFSGSFHSYNQPYYYPIKIDPYFNTQKIFSTDCTICTVTGRFCTIVGFLAMKNPEIISVTVIKFQKRNIKPFTIFSFLCRWSVRPNSGIPKNPTIISFYSDKLSVYIMANIGCVCSCTENETRILNLSLIKTKNESFKKRV
jgi:hypothetical protein